MPPKSGKSYTEKIARMAQLSIDLGLQQTESMRRQATTGVSDIITDKRVEKMQPQVNEELKKFADRYDAAKQQIQDERAAAREAAEREIKQEEESSDGGVPIKREEEDEVEESPPDPGQKQFANVFGSNNLPLSEDRDKQTRRVKDWVVGVEDGMPARDGRVNQEAYDVSQERRRFQGGYEGDMEESPAARVNNPSYKGKGKAPMPRSGLP